MLVEIDPGSGFCYGVINAIRKAEEELKKYTNLYCLGEIVHNNAEVERLKGTGLITIDHKALENLKNARVLIRAHGEPPETYQKASNQNLEIIDATCPVVLKLQERIRESYSWVKEKKGQIVIFGKKGHAEVNGLVGQTGNTAIVIEKTEDLNLIDFSKPIVLYSQTTMGVDEFNYLANILKLKGTSTVEVHDSVCRQVANRIPKLKEFVKKHNVALFVSGKHSSNGKMLYQICRGENERTHMVSEEIELNPKWFENCSSVGVCGATSTPMWLMENVAQRVKEITPK